MEADQYPPGTPCWVDVASADLDASVAFYNALFGWDVATAAPDGGDYRLFELGGKTVGGIRPAHDPAALPLWRAYVSVDDVDATAQAVRAAGGHVLVEPFAVRDRARLALCADGAGATFGVWQAGARQGAQLCIEPGTFCWIELACRDGDAAKTFYGDVFGWKGTTTALEGTSYSEFAAGASSVAGMILMTDQWPPDLPAHWMVYFAVEDCDVVADHVQRLGGRVAVPPTDIEPGRFAVVNDPQGNTFSIIAMRPIG